MLLLMPLLLLLLLHTASIKLDEPSWRAQLASTGGVALRSAQHAPLTITSGLCCRLFDMCHRPTRGQQRQKERRLQHNGRW